MYKVKIDRVGEIHKCVVTIKELKTLLLLPDRIRENATTSLEDLHSINKINIIDIHITLHSELYNKYSFF